MRERAPRRQALWTLLVAHQKTAPPPFVAPLFFFPLPFSPSLPFKLRCESLHGKPHYASTPHSPPAGKANRGARTHKGTAYSSLRARRLRAPTLPDPERAGGRGAGSEEGEGVLPQWPAVPLSFSFSVPSSSPSLAAGRGGTSSAYKATRRTTPTRRAAYTKVADIVQWLHPLSPLTNLFRVRRALPLEK